ncbi:5'/3'-nucleotidase SurE [Stomatohabitans albus]|uniref:5'/3'-nucleotidase SurE n=1 Tax=Stomatohabitans albus TaxID=3110766 RepID=UPI00300C82C1
MSQHKPLILVSNDDGIDAPGLYAAVKGASALGTVVVSAPAHQQSGVGRGLQRGPDVGTTQVTNRFEQFDKVERAQAVIGSPAQAVHVAILGYLKGRMPDLVITGVNLGYNVGSGIPASGTVGAAQEAWSLFGIPALAVSSQTLDHFGDGSEIDWDACAEVVAHWGAFILEHGLPEQVALLNVNIPIGATLSTTPMRRTIVSYECDWKYVDANGGRISPATDLRIIDNPHEERFEPDSDIRAVRDGVISVSPLRAQLATRSAWDVFDRAIGH